MSTTPITMKKLKDILRLKYGQKLTHRQIASSLSISPSVVSRYASRAAQMGITRWPLEARWDDVTLKNTFLQTRAPLKKHSLPDWQKVQDELKGSKLVTLQLLWEEYVDTNPAGYYSYNHYCRMYRQWCTTLRLSMRQTHYAGEKLFVDYCGPTVAIVNPDTGEYRTAQIFVAVLGASNYTYAEATWSQQLEDWIMSHVRCFDFLGGVPEIIIPDNLKSGVHKTCRYEPDLNPTYHQLSQHYDTAVIPARPYKPKDKSKAEVGVQIVERWIMGRIRKETFFSLKQLNQRIAELLTWMNQKVMQQYNESRLSLFQRLDRPALKSLPEDTYQFTFVKKVRVNIDYHVEIEKHYYSVHYTLVKKQLEAHVSGQLVCLKHEGNTVATHPRSYQAGRHSTQEEHMPKAHQKQQWSAERFEHWAKSIGPNTLQLIGEYLSSRKHPEQAYRVCLGVLNLSSKYNKERLENACQRALVTGAKRLKNISNILKKGLDKAPIPEQQSDLLSSIEHQNIRGNGYYH
ncbi:IS21-like element ISPsy14 family transposase [Colwellia sp. KU-HH00111]|uniref:IS21 family transposase n=1 Tax=Colwellia sp. KU-HH00111 TaxID=3127652 RepID=UPI003103F467